MMLALAIMLGASVGSFVNVIVDRMPAGRSIITPRSACEICNRTLSLWEMVPVLSYLWLKGRCRNCGVAIPVRLPMVEAVTALLFTAVYLRFGLGLEFVVLAAGVSLMLVVALIDLERGLILNRIIFPSLVVLVVLAPFWSELGHPRTFLGSHTMLASLLNSLVAGTGAFLVFLGIGLAFPAGMGSGDIKLAGVMGLLVGLPGVLIAMWIAMISAGVVAISLLLLHKKGRKDAIPFGPFLALGTAAVLLAENDILSWYQDVGAGLVSPWT